MSKKLSDLNDKEIKTLSETLRYLIDHIAGRIEYAESRRSSLTNIAAAILAAGAAMLTFGGTVVRYQPLWIAILVLSSLGIALALVIWILYALQTNFNYPFKGATKPGSGFIATRWTAPKHSNLPRAVLFSRHALYTTRPNGHSPNNR